MTITCRFCGSEFLLFPGKPGLRNVCTSPECVQQGERVRPEVTKVGGNMIWTHKTAPTLEIRQTVDEARRWARMERRRNAASPMTSILCARESAAGAAVEGKRGSGAEFYARYRSRLGEARVVKDRRRA